MVPAVNQIEVHPYLGNEEVRGYGQEHGILTEAWSPIAQGGVLDDPTITAIAERRGQDHRPGDAPLAHPARRHHLPQVDHPVADQGELRDLRLRADDNDMAMISALDKGEQGRTGAHPDTFA